MEDNLVLLPFWFRRRRVGVLTSSPLVFLDSLADDGCDSDAKALCLLPAAVCERRIVRGRGREMPLFVGRIEPIAVPSMVRQYACMTLQISPCVKGFVVLHRGRNAGESCFVAYLTTNRYAGGRPIVVLLLGLDRWEMVR